MAPSFPAQVPLRELVDPCRSRRTGIQAEGIQMWECAQLETGANGSWEVVEDLLIVGCNQITPALGIV